LVLFFSGGGAGSSCGAFESFLKREDKRLASRFKVYMFLTLFGFHSADEIFDAD